MYVSLNRYLHIDKMRFCTRRRRAPHRTVHGQAHPFHVYIYTHTYTHKYIYICMQVCIHIHIYMCVCVCVYICIYIFIFIYICRHVYVIPTVYIAYIQSRCLYIRFYVRPHVLRRRQAWRATPRLVSVYIYTFVFNILL